MNHYCARQRESDKRWEYTCKNDYRVRPVGYCNGHFGQGPKFHTDGHSSPEEACDCYREYLLDMELRLNLECDGLNKCVVCGTPTIKRARVEFSSWPLCDGHRTREQVEKMFKSVGCIITS
jgi:hypothetical protein